MSWENKTIYKFSFPVYFSPFTKYFTKPSGKVYAYQITRHAGYSLCSFLLCGLEGEILIMLLSLEQKHCCRQKYSISCGNWCVQQSYTSSSLSSANAQKNLN